MIRPHLEFTNLAVPLLTGTTIGCWENLSLPHDLPFIISCSHFTREKNNLGRSGTLSNASPIQHTCSHSNAFCVQAIPKNHATAVCRSTRNKSKQPLQCRLLGAFSEASQSCPSSPGGAILYEQLTVSLSGIHPNKPHATVMQPLQDVLP